MGKSCPVGKNIFYKCFLLAVFSVLFPVVGNGGIIINKSFFMQNVDQCGNDPLAHRENGEKGLSIHFSAFGFICPAGGKIIKEMTIVIDCKLTAALFSGRGIFIQNILQINFCFF